MLSKTTLQVVPINGVVFPHQSIQLYIPSTSSLFKKNLVGTSLGLCFQKDSTRKFSILSYLTDIGIIVKVTDEVTESISGEARQYKMIRGAAIRKFKLRSFLPKTQVLSAEVDLLPDEALITKDDIFFRDGVAARLKDLAYRYIELVCRNQQKLRAKLDLVRSENNLTKLHYIVASYLRINDEEKCKLLEIDNIRDRILRLISILEQELKTREADLFSGHGDEKAQDDSPRSPKRAKMENKQNNSLPMADASQEINVLEAKLKDGHLPEEAMSLAMQELKRLKQMDAQSSDYYIQKKYLDTVADLPWSQKSVENSDINLAEKVLEESHAGLEKIKERILEFLAVKILRKDSKGTILCLHGPPGVGKTSLGRSIAESLQRRFERIALGGVRDEAEVRGHRRTYVGAMPGTFIQSLLKCHTNNPVILLDEIDKVGHNSAQGDPSAALLEVLDPNQNSTFKDHYLGMPFDLSNVLFIATANSLDTIPAPLLDRMEVISLPGYTIYEKIKIAQDYLVGRQIEENGIDKNHLRFSADALSFIIKHYTAEPGVRNLERSIGAICRRVAFDFLKFQRGATDADNFNTIGCLHFPTIEVTKEFVEEILGPIVYENEIAKRIDQPGISIGLAWTSFGGKVLLIEAAKYAGSGKLQITGHLGDVMKESVMTAIGWMKAHTELIYLLTQEKKHSVQNFVQDSFFTENDLHIHCPAAAIPKDGPSAGITIVIALISLITNKKVKSDVAMTGEISLTGSVLPVGGIREKCLAAYSLGIKQVLLPYGNKKDIQEIPDEVKNGLCFHFIKHISEAIPLAIETDVSPKEVQDTAKFGSKTIHKSSKL